jgi:hypothetical protein
MPRAIILVSCLLVGTALAAEKLHHDPSLFSDPWKVRSWTGGYGWNEFPSSCHPLDYFSGTPLRFALGEGISHWPPNSFTYKTQQDFLGAIQSHQVYEILQQIESESQTTPEGWHETTMKRVVLERQPKEFCLIFQEEGTVGRSGDIVAINDAEIRTVDGEQVLLTDDLIPGTGEYTLDGAWILEDGHPISILDTAVEAVDEALREIMPAGCESRPDRNDLNLARLTAEVQLEPKLKASAGTDCGNNVGLELGIKNRKFVVVSHRLRPVSR